MQQKKKVEEGDLRKKEEVKLTSLKSHSLRGYRKLS